MKKKILAFLIAAVMIVSLSGCETITFNVLELMSPPKATGDKAAIGQLIDKEAGAGYTLKYPQSGNFRSAVTTNDFDGDGEEEAVAFYMPSGESETVHLLVMDSNGDEWKVVGNHKSESQAVDTLDFADLDNDGTYEIIVGWKTYNTLVNDLSVYIADESGSTEVTSSATYSNLICDDFTADGKDELLLLSLHTADKPATASLVTLSDAKNNLYTISTTDIDADTTSFIQTLVGNVSKGQFGVVLDGVTAGGTYNTQLLYFDSTADELIRVGFAGSQPDNQATRNYNVLSCDIDGDDVIEIPNAFKLNTEKTQPDAVPAALIYWCEYAPEGMLSIDTVTASSLVYGFNFTVPDIWMNNFTAFVNYSTAEIVFYEWTQENALGDALLIIKMFSKSEWTDTNASSGYTELDRNDAYVYSFMIPESNSRHLLTEDEIEESFSLMG